MDIGICKEYLDGWIVGEFTVREGQEGNVSWENFYKVLEGVL